MDSYSLCGPGPVDPKNNETNQLPLPPSRVTRKLTDGIKSTFDADPSSADGFDVL